MIYTCTVNLFLVLFFDILSVSRNNMPLGAGI